ncbi:MAG: argininosuccinate lyase [Candidatus Omnitrophica bacterium]|nr:argininosuccinate lyase [Candidatus Omnitrophota bacterium]
MTEKLWGGRFSKKTNPLVEEFTKSIQYDHKLAKYDVLGSLAHVKVLKKAGYLSAKEAAKLSAGLSVIYRSVENGSFKPDPAAEDIHTNIENILMQKAGETALKLHTARSRNEQVAYATKLYCKEKINELDKAASALITALNKLSVKYKGLIIPGFTHLQHAQPVYAKDYLGAYIEMLKRDKNRLGFIAANIKLTMGAGALAGTPIQASKYEHAAVNSLDSVSDRDFIAEILSALSIIGMHLSRLAEDLIIWSTKEFGVIAIDDAFCTGSSLMPQKKNPDVLELIRGYAGRLYGNLVSVLTMMKGLPLAYNRDMQLDKEPLFESFELGLSELKVMTGLIATLKFNKDKIADQLEDESLYATDLVYYLVDKGVAFKNAHTIIGKLVAYSVNNAVSIQGMDDYELRKFSDKLIKKEIIKLFDPLISVKSKRSIKR